jgi:hypothetical protein
LCSPSAVGKKKPTESTSVGTASRPVTGPQRRYFHSELSVRWMPTATSGWRLRMSTVSWYHGVANITDTETGRPVSMSRSSAMFTL